MQRVIVDTEEAKAVAVGCDACEYALNYWDSDQWELFFNRLRERVCVSPLKWVEKGEDEG